MRHVADDPRHGVLLRPSRKINRLETASSKVYTIRRSNQNRQWLGARRGIANLSLASSADSRFGFVTRAGENRQARVFREVRIAFRESTQQEL